MGVAYLTMEMCSPAYEALSCQPVLLQPHQAVVVQPVVDQILHYDDHDKMFAQWCPM